MLFADYILDEEDQICGFADPTICRTTNVDEPEDDEMMTAAQDYLAEKQKPLKAAREV